MVYIILALILSIQVVLSSYESPFFFAYLWDKDYEMNTKTCIHWTQGPEVTRGEDRTSSERPEWNSPGPHPVASRTEHIGHYFLDSSSVQKYVPKKDYKDKVYEHTGSFC
ncbi:hypothetical protein llap_9177 [Limosa lapponica baueri]|uniref:Uncharacterized protein n=1 Tax=Limosa lapponica baueri TaxID=1758121 RepID=A0A2I0U3B6_LIMLA|nr:hypothetical protein llap_9177 [Limosa lapponica baueri]